jgi:hypothetical protein
MNKISQMIDLLHKGKYDEALVPLQEAINELDKRSSKDVCTNKVYTQPINYELEKVT